MNIQSLPILPRSFYERSTLQAAKELLGKYLILDEKPLVKIGKIIETEAYPGVGDRASHSHKSVTGRTQVLFGPAGHTYVYLIYGIYYCLNIVTDTPESGGAVLIRAIEPVTGLDGKTSGPGLVCKAYGITREHNGLDVTKAPLTIREASDERNDKIVASTRIGIDYAGTDKHQLYRYRIAT